MKFSKNRRQTPRTPFGEERLAHTSKRPPGKAAAGKNARPTVWAALGNYFRVKEQLANASNTCRRREIGAAFETIFELKLV
jgi:hypothetical protein